MPLVSLVITVYNREQFLPQTIASILASDFTDFEVIVWDDGSTDNSYAIAQSFAEQDSRIRAINGGRRGRIPSLIAASCKANGKYIGVVDSDDWISPNTLSASVEAINSDTRVGMTYTNCILVNARGDEIKQRPQSGIPYSRDRLLIDFICFHFRLMARELVEKVGGYDLDILYCEDYDITLKLSEITEVLFVPQATYFYRQHLATQGAKYQIERLYWTKQVIQNSLVRRGDHRQLEVRLSQARFRLTN